MLKKKQHLWLLYSFFVCRLNLSVLQVPSVKQLKHKIHHGIAFSICPFANKHLVRLWQLKRTAVLRNSNGRARRQDLKREKINLHNTTDSKTQLLTRAAAAVPKQILCNFSAAALEVWAQSLGWALTTAVVSFLLLCFWTGGAQGWTNQCPHKTLTLSSSSIVQDLTKRP